jgi:hypothetical protein
MVFSGACQFFPLVKLNVLYHLIYIQTWNTMIMIILFLVINRAMIVSFPNVYCLATVIAHDLVGEQRWRRNLTVHSVAFGAEELLPVICLGLEFARLVSSRECFLGLVSIQNIFLGFNDILLPIAFLHNGCHVFLGQLFLKLVSV